MAHTSNAQKGGAALLALVLAGAAMSGCARPTAAANAPAVNVAAVNGTPVSQGGNAPPVSTTVPFVGCAQDGQTGPKMAPSGSPKTVVLDPNVAGQLAYYASSYVGVLGPKGWYCFGTYGSSGWSLFLSPSPIRASDVEAERWNAGAGPALEVAVSSGDTSGRFNVAQAIVRAFPSHMAFARQVASDSGGPTPNFAVGPFPADQMTAKSDTVVEYTTAPNAQGLGTTFSLLTASAAPIDGVAILQGPTPDLYVLAARLPNRSLINAIMPQFEADTAATPAPSADAAPAPAAAQQSAPTSVATPVSNASSPLGVVQAFYAALGQGDGATASRLVIPQKRAGNFSAAALSSYYGRMSQPLQLLGARQTGPGTVAVRYSFVAAGGHACNGAANVQTVEAGGQTLIAGIAALSGC
jgi:hypothetical protein